MLIHTDSMVPWNADQPVLYWHTWTKSLLLIDNGLINYAISTLLEGQFGKLTLFILTSIYLYLINKNMIKLNLNKNWNAQSQWYMYYQFIDNCPDLLVQSYTMSTSKYNDHHSMCRLVEKPQLFAVWSCQCFVQIF